MFHFNNWSFSGGLRSGIATSYASARARSDSCAYHALGVGVDQTAFMQDGDQWQCPSDCPQKASRIIDIIVHRNLKTVKCLFASFKSSSYSAITISLDLRVS